MKKGDTVYVVLGSPIPKLVVGKAEFRVESESLSVGVTGVFDPGVAMVPRRCVFKEKMEALRYMEMRLADLLARVTSEMNEVGKRVVEERQRLEKIEKERLG